MRYCPIIRCFLGVVRLRVSVPRVLLLGESAAVLPPVEPPERDEQRPRLAAGRV